MPEVTSQYIRLPVKTPAGNAQIRTMSLDQAKGIWALYDKANGEIVTYLFRRDKGWDMEKAKAWTDKHKSGHRSQNAQARWVGWDGDDALRAVFAASGEVQIFEDDPRFEGEHIESVNFMAAGGKPLVLQHVERDENGVPTAIRLLAFGKWDIPKYGGDLIVDQSTGEGTLAYQAWRGMEQLLVDRDHKSKVPVSAGGSTRARGWWTPEVRADGIWATEIKWSAETYKELADGQWRYFSPTGGFNKETKHVEFLDTFALTNDPATLGQMPLTATMVDSDSDDGGNSAPAANQPDTPGGVDGDTTPSTTGDKEMEKVREILGLQADATEDEVLEAVAKIKTTADTADASAKEIETLKASMSGNADHAEELEALKAFKASTLEACELGEDKDGKDVLAYVSTLQAKAPEADKAAKLEAKVAELEKFREDTRIAGLMASVDDYVTTENRERVEKLARTLDGELFTATVTAWPKVKGEGKKPISDRNLNDRNGMDDDGILTAEDRELIASKGFEKDSDEEKKYVKEFIAIRKMELGLP